MIGFNGGLIGKTRVYASSGANSGVWALNEILQTRRNPLASGGDVSGISDGGLAYTLHSFTSVGQSSFVVTNGGMFEYLIIGGGSGGDGGLSSVSYGNGGAAGIARSGSIILAPATYTIIVGAGGARSFQVSSSAGGSSSAMGITATGGNATILPGRTGASNADYIGGTGVGGFNAGGGAGAAGNGNSFNGGAGFTSTITGASVVRGGGGASFGGTAGTGGGGAAGEPGGNGAPNTGSGGGGGGSTSGGGNGGSGVVYIRYRV